MNTFYLTPKLFTCMKGYNGKQLVKDFVAGLIVAIIALPLSIALAIASGVPPVAGVYTAIAAGFVVSLLGGSRVQIAGPTAAFATTVAGIVAVKGMDGLIIATIMAGIILIVMGVCKLGTLIKYIPTSITVGFTSGIAVTIVIGQIKSFFGLAYAPGINPIETFEKIEANVHAFPTFSWQALFVGALCLAFLIGYPKLDNRIPPSLVAVAIGIVMVRCIPALENNVSTIGDLYDIPAGVSFVSFGEMDFSFGKILSLVPDALTIAVLAAIESLLSCVVADTMVNSKHNPNAELVAQGMG
ncbi:MAG: sodium-independent anion transporter, partial [Clostridia bacterium]|nr:sodium-independent anion transporter [Clostridia bacterium]